MRAAVILSTYDWPRALELSVWSYAVQTRRDFQLVIADDGSGPETAALIERLRAETALDLLHVWQPDDGFRKSEILNRAIVATDAEYLIFSDGDTIARRDLVETHLRLAERGRFLAGGYLKLPPETSEAIDVAAVRDGRATQLGWLRAHGYRPRKHALRFVRQPALAAALDRLTSFKLRWHGNNASTFREHILAVDGFDMNMGYGGQDAALGERLENLGIRPKRVRYRTLAVHLHHERPWRDPEGKRRIVETRQAVKRSRATRAARGISQLEPLPAGANPSRTSS